MPARDLIHAAARLALERDGWTITADPFVLPVGSHNLYVDLAAERVIAAERGAERIAVEAKSFVGRSEIADLEQALGQFVLYRSILRRREADRTMVLAVPEAVWVSLFEAEVGQIARQDLELAMMVFDTQTKEVTRWFR